MKSERRARGARSEKFRLVVSPGHKLDASLQTEVFWSSSSVTVVNGSDGTDYLSLLVVDGSPMSPYSPVVARVKLRSGRQMMPYTGE